jgi:hypothetical protein
MPFSVTSQTNLSCQWCISSWTIMASGLGASGPPPASCQCIRWQAPTASAQFLFGTGTAGGYARRVLSPKTAAVLRVLCQYTRAQPEGFKLAWHRDWHHCEIGTPDPVVYIVPLSHILGRPSLLLLPAGNFGTIHLLLLATCRFRFIHADTGIYMQIHAIHADTCKILHVCIWYV